MEALMNEQSNAPMPVEPAGIAGWFSTWMRAITKPNEQTFVELANSRNAKATTAYLWVFLGSLITFFFASLVQGDIMANLMQNAGVSDGAYSTGLGGGLFAAICGAPIGGVISVVMFAVVTAIVQWIAKMFGGRGTFDQLAYTLAAIYTPFSLISAVLTLLAAIPFVGACFGIVSLVASLYALVLQVMAVKGVNQFGWGQAIGSLLIPVFVVFCCVAVVVTSMLSLLAPAISETFNSITP
jgi:Flp pilus assembly pilin Flp